MSKRAEFVATLTSMGVMPELAAVVVNQVDIQAPNATEQAFQWMEENPEASLQVDMERTEVLVGKLVKMGFSRERAANALKVNSRDLAKSINWLMEESARELAEKRKQIEESLAKGSPKGSAARKILQVNSQILGLQEDVYKYQQQLLDVRARRKAKKDAASKKPS